MILNNESPFIFIIVNPAEARQGMGNPAKGQYDNTTVASAETAVASPRAIKLPRAEKARLVREALVSAAIEVVGEVGYADASVAQITARAGIAQGTFYNYFETRQQLFDSLLPELGGRMLGFIRQSARGGQDFAALEERAFKAFFAFLRTEPQLFRILNEAEYCAPAGHQQHFDLVSDEYQAFLRKCLSRGEFPAFDERELEVVAHILMSARLYLAMRFKREDEKDGVPEWVVRSYMKFVLYGLKGAPAD